MHTNTNQEQHILAIVVFACSISRNAIASAKVVRRRNTLADLESFDSTVETCILKTTLVFQYAGTNPFRRTCDPQELQAQELLKSDQVSGVLK